MSSTRAERITARANVHLNGVAHMELRARDGDPTFDNSVWVRGHLVYWWKPEIEQLKRDGRLGEALELAWECMEAVEQEFWANASGNYAYGWAWEVALIARKAKRFELEVDVINHVLDIDAFTDLALEHWQKRLATAQRLLAKSSS